MGDPEDDEEIEFASPPCSLSELSPEFAGIAPRKVEKKAKGRKRSEAGIDQAPPLKGRGENG